MATYNSTCKHTYVGTPCKHKLLNYLRYYLLGGKRI
jgi:hypothetical protein